MKLFFSECKSDYGHYVFPYAVWGMPEKGETPADFFERGFLPGSRDLDRFYLCRQTRVDLKRFRLSSENRRILRKGAGVEAQLSPRATFKYTQKRKQFFKTYADIKFGKNVMNEDRLDSLFNGPLTSHVLVFQDKNENKEVGVATLFLQEPRVAYYYYAFYDLNYYARNLGMHMMTSAVGFFAKREFDYLYLGSVYSKNALYKTQFKGAQFFNGVQWSENLDEVKYLIERDGREQRRHLLEDEEYQRLFRKSPDELKDSECLFSTPIHDS